MDLQLDYVAPPTLAAFLRSDDYVRFVSGPVGSGKSSAGIIELIRRACTQAKGPDGIRRTRFAVIRNTFPQLRDTTRKSFEQWIPAALGKWHEQEFCFTLEFNDVHSEILFRALDRPEDIRKLLSLELTGAWLNEAREISKHVFDLLDTRIGRYPSKAQGGCTWFGIWGDTNPWHTGHWARKMFDKGLPGYRLFRQPGGLTPDAENVSNLPPGYYQRLSIGKTQDWIDVYVNGLEASSDVGSIFGDLLDGVKKRDGIVEFDAPTDGVFTSWDLGFTDSTSIWFWRLCGSGVDFIDHYEAHGKPLSHFFDVIESKGYQYVKHWLPHDAQARTLATGSSIEDQFLERFGREVCAMVPKLSILDGIQAGRWVLEQPTTRFHKEKCKAGVESLYAYRYEWDEVDRCFSKKPLHDFSSHDSDAFRYCAVVVKFTELMLRKPVQKELGPIAVPLSEAYTLDRLYKDRDGGRARI